MSSFSRPDFVEEFAFRTRSNYYSLMIAHGREQNMPEMVGEYEQKLVLLKREMELKSYHTQENYYEVTQLINSLIGLLIFPEQQYYNELKSKNLSFNDDLKTLGTIISCKKKGSYFSSYKQLKTFPLSNDSNNIVFKSNRRYVIERLFESLDPEKESPYSVLKHMRNAVAHENIGIIPVNSNEKITSIVFEDYGIADYKSKNINGEISISAYYRTPSKPIDNTTKRTIRDNLRYGYFRLEIGVEDLEMVLTEVSNAILSVSR